MAGVKVKRCVMKRIAYYLLITLIIFPNLVFAEDSWSSVAILWAYVDKAEASKRTKPLRKEIVGAWNVPGEGKWKIVSLLGEGLVNQEKARKFHLSEIQKQIGYVKEFTQENEKSISSKNRSHTYITGMEAKIQRINHYWYSLQVLSAQEISNLNEILELDEYVNKLQ